MGAKICMAIVVLAFFILSGCASDSVRIYKLGANDNIFFGDVVADGCIVAVKGQPANLAVYYRDSKCSIIYGDISNMPELPKPRPDSDTPLLPPGSDPEPEPIIEPEPEPEPEPIVEPIEPEPTKPPVIITDPSKHKLTLSLHDTRNPPYYQYYTYKPYSSFPKEFLIEVGGKTWPVKLGKRTMPKHVGEKGADYQYNDWIIKDSEVPGRGLTVLVHERHGKHQYCTLIY